MGTKDSQGQLFSSNRDSIVSRALFFDGWSIASICTRLNRNRGGEFYGSSKNTPFLDGNYLTDLSWPVAMMFGAIIIVTGPTVIMPLLKQANLKQRPAALLR